MRVVLNLTRRVALRGFAAWSLHNIMRWISVITGLGWRGSFGPLEESWTQFEFGAFLDLAFGKLFQGVWEEGLRLCRNLLLLLIIYFSRWSTLYQGWLLLQILAFQTESTTLDSGGVSQLVVLFLLLQFSLNAIVIKSWAGWCCLGSFNFACKALLYFWITRKGHFWHFCVETLWFILS